MRVCLVSHEYPPQTADGGIGTQTWNKAHGLTAAGHTVEVVSSSDAGAKETTRTVNESGITVHRLRAPGECATGSLPLYEQAAYQIGYSWLVLEHVHRVHSERPFDLINFPEYGADGFVFQLNRSIYNWVPVIVQLHAPLAMLAERMGWPDKQSNFYRTASFMEGESIRLADGWMASSANIADFAANVYGLPRDEIYVVHCGIDCKQFSPRAVGHKTQRRPIVLFMGNIAESKGVTSVFEAVLRLRHRFPDILLRIVGKSNQLSERLLAQAKAAEATNHVEWHPFMKDRASIAAQFQQADVFASPADHENGVANVYVEAMACGCPVIAGQTGGAPEAVTDGETGLLIPPRNVEATAAAIERILGDEALRKRMRVAARVRAVTYFAQEKYIQRVLTAYEKTIARSREKLARLQAAEAS
jgi:glycosyltransferase involved in cell wall biosynthesis